MTRQSSKLKQQSIGNDDAKKILPPQLPSMPILDVKFLTVAKIKEILDNLGVKYDSKLRKQDLLTILDKHQNGFNTIKDIYKENITNNVNFNIKEIATINPMNESSEPINTATRKYQLRNIDLHHTSKSPNNTEFIFTSLIPKSNSKSRNTSKSVKDPSPQIQSIEKDSKRKRKPSSAHSPDYEFTTLVKRRSNTRSPSATTSKSRSIKSPQSDNINDLRDRIYTHTNDKEEAIERKEDIFINNTMKQDEPEQPKILELHDLPYIEDEEEDDDDDNEFFDVKEFMMDQGVTTEGHPQEQIIESLHNLTDNNKEMEEEDWKDNSEEGEEQENQEINEEEEEEVETDDNDDHKEENENEEDEEEEICNEDSDSYEECEEEEGNDDEGEEETDEEEEDYATERSRSFLGYVTNAFSNNAKPSSYLHSNEVVDLVSSDEECENTKFAPTITQLQPKEMMIPTQPIVNNSISTLDTIVAKSEIVVPVVAVNEVNNTSRAATIGESNQHVETKQIDQVKHALTKLGNRFVSVVASNLANDDSSNDNKLTEEDYYLLRTYLEKNKPVSIVTNEPKASINVRFAEEKSQTDGHKPNITIDTTIDDFQKDEMEIDNTNTYAPTSTYIPTPAPAQMGKSKFISFNSTDAAIPRPSYDGGAWASRESFLPSLPDTPLVVPHAQSTDTFKIQSVNTNSQIQQMQNVSQNKRSIYEAGFSDINTAHAGATPFHTGRNTILDSSQASKRVSLDGYRSIVNRQATPGAGAFDKFGDIPFSSDPYSNRNTSRIGSGEIGFSVGVPKFQVRQSYTPMFRGNSVQFASSSYRADTGMNKILDSVDEKSHSKPTVTTITTSNTLANSNNINSTGLTLSYIQRRRLQREAASNQSAAMAQKILQTLTGITSPIEQQRQKPIPITWKDDITSSSSINPITIATTSTSNDSVIASSSNKPDSSTLISKIDENNKSILKPLNDNPFLHNSLRSKPLSNIPQNIQEIKTISNEKLNPPKVSFEFPKTPAAAAGNSNEKSNQNEKLISNIIQNDQEFTFEEPMIISGIEENETEVKKRNSGVGIKSFNTDQKIKYMFSASKPKLADTSLSSTAIKTVSHNVTDNLPQKQLTTVSEVVIPTVNNIWAASSINDGIKCKVCMVKNKKDATKCASCESPLELGSSVTNPTAPQTIVNASSAITPVNNIWAASSINDGIKCKVCMVKNKKDAIKCASCESPLDTITSVPSSSNSNVKDNFSNNKPSTDTSSTSFSFGIKSSDTNKKPADNKPVIGFTFGSSSSIVAPTPLTSNAGFSFPSATTDTNLTSKVSTKSTFEGFSLPKSDINLNKPFGVDDDKHKTNDANTRDIDEDQPKSKRKAFDSDSSSDVASSSIPLSKPFMFTSQNANSNLANSDSSSKSTTSGFVFGASSSLTALSSAPIVDNSIKPFTFPSSSTDSTKSSDPIKPSFGFDNNSTTLPTPTLKSSELVKPFVFGSATTAPKLDTIPSTAASSSTSFTFGGSTSNVAPVSTSELAVKPFSFGGISNTNSNDATATKAVLPFSSTVPNVKVDSSKPFTFGAVSNSSNIVQNDTPKALTFGSTISTAKSSSEPSISSNPGGLQPFMFGSSTSAFPSVSTTASSGSVSGPFSTSRTFGSVGNNTTTTPAFGSGSGSDIFKVGTNAFGNSAATLGKPPLATTTSLGSSSLTFPINGVASVDQSNSNRTITPAPIAFGTQNTITMDSPNSTMDTGGNSNLSAPNSFANPTTSAFGIATSNTNPFASSISNNNSTSGNMFGTSGNTFGSYQASNTFGQISAAPVFGNSASSSSASIPLFGQQAPATSNIPGPFSTINTPFASNNSQSSFSLGNSTSLGTTIPSSNSFNIAHSFGNTSLPSNQSFSSQPLTSMIDNNGSGGFSLGVTDNKNNANNANRRKILKAKRPGGA